MFAVVNDGARAQAADAETVKILALGDSLTAGYNLPPGDAFPVRLEAALRDRGHAVRVVNAGVSGDTTAGGLARLGWLLDGEAPDAVIVELGANDALRGLPPQKAEENLAAILQSLADRNIPTLLAGMYAPRNLGPEYIAAFDGLYPRLAERFDVPLYPFFLEGVALQDRYLLSDGLHPNAEGVQVMVDNILPHVEALVERARQTSG
ncbi:arylesterase [Caenispirillum bisanense]|uniref:arylesterase n=1 Tax=Caenispirillum bisanense TaxID=414052 RepID=UPI0031E033EE